MTRSQQDGADVKLSGRLAALADWVPVGARFADIGADHALLPVYLSARDRVSFAVAGDVNKGPVEAARRQVQAAGLDGAVSVRHGDGLSVLEPGEVDTVCIAGMGGSLMVRLLNEAGPRLDAVRTLILSPHVAEDQVRQWLIDHAYVLVKEKLLEEDGEIYTLLKAEQDDAAEAAKRNGELYSTSLLKPCCPEVPLALVREMGPLLLRGTDETFRRKWEFELAKRENIRERLRLSQSEEATQKALEWERTIANIKEVLACWPAARR